MLEEILLKKNNNKQVIKNVYFVYNFLIIIFEYNIFYNYFKNFFYFKWIL